MDCSSAESRMAYALILRASLFARIEAALWLELFWLSFIHLIIELSEI